MSLVFTELHTLFPLGEPQISQIHPLKGSSSDASCQLKPPMPIEQNQGHNIFSIKPKTAPKCSTAGKTSILLPIDHL